MDSVNNGIVRYPETYQTFNHGLDDYPFLIDDGIPETNQSRVSQANPLGAIHQNPSTSICKSWQEMEEKIESQQELINTLMANCKLMERMVSSSRQRSEHGGSLALIAPQSPAAAGAHTNHDNACRMRAASLQPSSGAAPTDLSTASLMRMFDEVLVCLDQIELTVDRDVLHAIPADSSQQPAQDPAYTHAAARVLAGGTPLRLLRAELRLKAAVVASTAGAVRAKLERSAAARARLAAAADGLSAQLAAERRAVAALRAQVTAASSMMREKEKIGRASCRERVCQYV